MAVVGADPFVLEGSDVTLILKVRNRELFERRSALWLEKARAKHPELTDPRVQLSRQQGDGALYARPAGKLVCRLARGPR